MLWRIALAVAVGALAFFATTPAPARLMRRAMRRGTNMDPITYGKEHQEDEMGEPVEYEVLRDHGAKAGGEMGPAFRKGDTRELRPEDAKPLVRAGVLKPVGGNGDDEGDAPAGKMEGRPLNKMEGPAPEAKRGPGRPRKVADDDEDEA